MGLALVNMNLTYRRETPDNFLIHYSGQANSTAHKLLPEATHTCKDKVRLDFPHIAGYLKV